MDSIGIDSQRRRSHIAAIDDEGIEVLSRRITNDPTTSWSCYPSSPCCSPTF